MQQLNYKVCGTITTVNGQPIAGLTVRAADKDINGENSLGKPCRTDEYGYYEIKYADEEFRMTDQEKGGADIIVRVYKDNIMIMETPTKNNAALEEEINITIPSELVTSNLVLTGLVTGTDGKPATRQKLVVYAAGLRGVSKYKSFEKTGSLTDTDDFEYLATVNTGRKGKYRCKLSKDLLAPVKNKTGIIIYSVEGEDEITGHSRLVKSGEYESGAIIHNLNIIIGRNIAGLTEYEKLMEKLEPVLVQNKVNLSGLVSSLEQIEYVSDELVFDKHRIEVASKAAKRVEEESNYNLSHELFYGLGRQNIDLDWQTLYLTKEDELQQSLANSVKENIIHSFTNEEIQVFFDMVHAIAVNRALDYKGNDNSTTLDTVLSYALPDKKLRNAFVGYTRKFKGTPEEFWKNYLPSTPEFKNQPQFITELLCTNQLTLLTGNNQELVNELQKNKKVKNANELIDISLEELKEIVLKTGVPNQVKGNTESERAEKYAGYLFATVHAAFPTKKIESMLENKELKVNDNNIFKGITSFLKSNSDFNISKSRIVDFEEKIKEISPEHHHEVKTELAKIQRIFQVSLTPGMMKILMELGFGSAYEIAQIPERIFIKRFGKKLGGRKSAKAVHEKAVFLSYRNEHYISNIRDYLRPDKAELVTGAGAREEAREIIEGKVPNFTNLFGRPDICECKSCQSVYSPAAYFVDLIRFLWRGNTNLEGDGAMPPYNLLKKRRPDLWHIPLTCENANTLIPYIDLVNEIMEYYIVHHNLGDENGSAANDTSDTTSKELRANPQHVIKEAYRILKDEVYPFTMPYNYPLDVIRSFSEQLNTSRFEIMEVMQKTSPDESAQCALDSESLLLSEEEFVILTGVRFDGATDVREVYSCYGYTSGSDLEQLVNVPEFLKRSGIAYTELVDLIKTQFINPHQDLLNYINILFKGRFDSTTLYEKLSQIYSGGLPSTDGLWEVLAEQEISSGEFTAWIEDNFVNLKSVITLFEPNSGCNLETTSISTLEKIYEDGENNVPWSAMHRFIRLWKKLGWTIHETDLILTALGENDIRRETIQKLSAVKKLQKLINLPLEKLACFWGNIDAKATGSLYKKLFLNKNTKDNDEVFEMNKWGYYLPEGSEVKIVSADKDYLPEIQSAFRISNEELKAILEVAEIDDNGTIRHIVPDTDCLTLSNMSILYRYCILAKGLKTKITDLCRIKQLFDKQPFSTWRIDSPGVSAYNNISPENTLAFAKLITSIKSSEFNADKLQYIFTGISPVASSLSPDNEKIKAAMLQLRPQLLAIDNEHQTEGVDVTIDLLKEKLQHTFQEGTITIITGILQNNYPFYTTTVRDLTIIVPDSLYGKYAYNKANGTLICKGIMTQGEKDVLSSLEGAIPEYVSALQELFDLPEKFLNENCNKILTSDEVSAVLDRSEVEVLSQAEKLALIYRNYIPYLRTVLQERAIIKPVAGITEISEPAVKTIMDSRTDKSLSEFIDGLSMTGFSATYYDNSGTAIEGKTAIIDQEINFDWSVNPDPLIASDSFSARWTGFIVPPTDEKYTLVVEVKDRDDVFSLFLDKELLVEKPAGNENLGREIEIPLKCNTFQNIEIEYRHTGTLAGIKFSWKTATMGKVIVPSAILFPGSVISGFENEISIVQRAALFINSFKLKDTELQHIVDYKPNFDDLDIRSIRPGNWLRMYDYHTLREELPQTQASLTDVFSAANISEDVESFKNIVQQATSWNMESIDLMMHDDYFGLTIDDFRNEKALLRMQQIMELSRKTSASVNALLVLGVPGNEYEEFEIQAILVKRITRAKYEEQDWVNVSTAINNKLRENRKQALINYLLMPGRINDWGEPVMDADSLFEYFLIDVQMGACMDTSRIVQANSSIQMLVNRILMNKEKDVSPDAIDKNRWEWLRNYRVWEANRKIFLYPENWLEPEWRDNKSPFFKELESEITENDITNTTAESAFRNYLSKLDEIANLKIAGMFHDKETGIVHVFGHTQNPPYQYYYRKLSKQKEWSPWEKVPLDIKAIDDKENSGVHLIPVVWKNRLVLFWPEFFKAQDTDSLNEGQEINDMASQSVGELSAKEYWQIRLAFSECAEGKWSDKKLSNTYLVSEFSTDIEKISNYGFLVDMDENDNFITLYLGSRYHDWSQYDIKGYFRLFNLNKEIIAYQSNDGSTIKPGYLPDICTRFNYMNGTVNNFYLKFFNTKVILEKSFDYYLLYSNNINHQIYSSILPGSNYQLSSDNPFFLSSRQLENTDLYFVCPTDSPIENTVQDPESYNSVSGCQFSVSNLFTETINSSRIPSSFGGVIVESPDDLVFVDYVSDDQAHSFEFHTFYHPYANTFIENLNQGGIPALIACNTGSFISSEDGPFKSYDPNFEEDVVLYADESSYPGRTFYKEKVCFDYYGSYSLYNWEMFFHAPLYIAVRLSKNGRHEDAMRWFHYIFDPTTDELPAEGAEETSRYWKISPFKTAEKSKLEEWFKQELEANSNRNLEHDLIAQWRDKPFRAHLIARNRISSYMQHVVLKYIENIIAWGDSLFRADTMESVNQATQLYVIASHILGSRPDFIPQRGKINKETFATLESKLDDFSNALVQMENLFPFSSRIELSETSTDSGLLGIGQTLYFCIPNNEKLLGYWDTVEDRLFKIRHCMNIEGIERTLSLLAPPIDPGLLAKAAAQGTSISSILNGLNSPASLYRFRYCLQKANEFCADVKSLGNALLSSLEKKDNEELSRLRATHEVAILNFMTETKKQQILEAEASRENLLKARELAIYRVTHYLNLLGKDIADLNIPGLPELTDVMINNSELPVDTLIDELEVDVDVSLNLNDPKEIKKISKEKEEIGELEDSFKNQNIAAGIQNTSAAILALLPTVAADAQPFGVGGEFWWGGENLSNAAQALSGYFNFMATKHSNNAKIASINASYIRREQEWTFQANLAGKEIVQLDKQITSADIRLSVANKELETHLQQIKNADEVKQFLETKFSKTELYQWMKEQLYSVYKQSFNLAFDMAQKAEQAYRYETGKEQSNYIQYGYWDNTYEGLVAGDKLQLALHQLEKSYLEENNRELELTKHISVSLLNPVALQQLKETGKCSFTIPEEVFDMDFQGHFFRRIKSVSLSVPCVAGPYSSVNCSLRLLKNAIRVNSQIAGGYVHNHEEGIWIDDDRFRSSNVPVQSIATSQAQNASGVFELNFHDERYLPFEGAGVISDWQIELTTKEELRQFDYSTISDVVLHVNYTAREAGGTFKDEVAGHLLNYFKNEEEGEVQPLMQLLNINHQFPSEWYRFLHPSTEGEGQELRIEISPGLFPYFTRKQEKQIKQVDLFVKANSVDAPVYSFNLRRIDSEGSFVDMGTGEMSYKYAGDDADYLRDIRVGTITIEGELAPENLHPLSLRISNNGDDYASLDEDELVEMYMIFHYCLKN